MSVAAIKVVLSTLEAVRGLCGRNIRTPDGKWNCTNFQIIGCVNNVLSISIICNVVQNLSSRDSTILES